MPYYQSRDEIVINAPLERAYRALTDWEERSRWRKGMRIHWHGSPRAFVGQEINFDIAETIPPARFGYRITGLEPNQRIFMEYQGCSLEGRAAIEVTPLEKGCRVAFYWMKVRPKGFLAWLYFRLGWGLASHKRRTRQTLELLKKHLESTNH